jgi:hypothetical protein
VDPEELLLTDREGNRTQLQDVIYEGLDHDYSDRHPALLRLMREGTPRYRLYACVMLASWGVREGLETLSGWALDPDSTPWAGEPVTYDRFFGVDGAFEMLTEAVQTAGSLDRSDELDALRADATRALLDSYDRIYFARSLMVLLDVDRDLAASVRSSIALAVERAVVAARSPSSFDMPTQAAFLLGPLSTLDDERAAHAAEALLADHPGNSRTLREVAHMLGGGTGPATLAVLQRLAASPLKSVATDAQYSLTRRGMGSQVGGDK